MNVSSNDRFVFSKSVAAQDSLREAIDALYFMDETECVERLLKEAALSPALLEQVANKAQNLVTSVREKRLQKGGLDAFLHQYDLSSEEGIALMCLAEAMLRVPDKQTIDRLICDKITTADWQAHTGKSSSFFVNAATWGLMLTGRVLGTKENFARASALSLQRLIQRTGEPFIRKAVAQAMKILGHQFVMGRSIKEALKNAKPCEQKGYTYSYDMLGEAAYTAEDAERYFQAYQAAITEMGLQKYSGDIFERPSISIKLSALHPRYEYAQSERALPALVDKLCSLAKQARGFGIGVTVDAEEAARLELSLDIFSRVLHHPDLSSWEGLGLAVQAYQKRAPAVLDWLIALARARGLRIPVRLVKGAYWDTEIKHAQVQGLSGYPVFTRKLSTDVSFIACARKMAAAGDALYAQFATHNARTTSLISVLMQGRRDFEFQCLHGMGGSLYDDLVSATGPERVRCRIYAPVGNHKDLLPYLVRRLLENGANTSFVHRIIDEKAPVAELIRDPVQVVAALSQKPSPRIPLPQDLYGSERRNAAGIEFTHYSALSTLATAMETSAMLSWTAEPTISLIPGQTSLKAGTRCAIVAPQNHAKVVGHVTESTSEQVNQAIIAAYAAFSVWDGTSVEKRASCLQRAADLFEAHRAELMTLLVQESGKTLPDALSEVREAVDFCRYYAAQGLHCLKPRSLPGPTGESNHLSLHGRGVFLCISPWNFPLAIFTGQVVAALMAGNTVIAKPAHQTPLIAARAVRLLHQAGVPTAALQLLPGSSRVVGVPLLEDQRIQGVLFTGSTETAHSIQQTLAARFGPIVPFIAETGGQNAMIADSTALPEQLVRDVMISAFGSAGQRCSALRVLFIQEEIADKVLTMLKGAMAEWRLGDPALLSTDIGPIIDQESRTHLEAHIAYLHQVGRFIASIPDAVAKADPMQHSFLAPHAFEIAGLHLLKEEIFGPILHVVRYASKALDAVIDAINGTGFGLTLGVHSRIDETVDYIRRRVRVGNFYVNRSMIGAVVGVQPFGGEGLSGTGPKAGGPHYLLRLCQERTVTINTAAVGGNASLMTLSPDE